MTPTRMVRGLPAVSRLQLAAILCALSLAACGSGGQSAQHVDRVHPGSSRLGSVALPAVLSTPPVGARFPHEGDVLTPGLYASRTNPAVLVRLPAGWHYDLRVGESLHRVALFQRAHGSDDDAIVFMDPQSVYGATPRNNPPQRPLPRNLVGWLEHFAPLKAAPAKPVRIGGVTGSEVSVTPRHLSGATPVDCVEPCIPVFGPEAFVTSGYAVFIGDYRDVFDVLRVHGKPLVIWTSIIAAGHRRWERQAAAVLRTVRFP